MTVPGQNPDGVLGRLLGRLLEMAEAARLDPLSIDTGSLLGATLDVAADALGRVRSYIRKDGSVVEGADPDHGSVIRALALAAQIRGAIKPEDQPQVTFEQFQAQLKAHGLKVVPDPDNSDAGGQVLAILARRRA
jgi:hypothetical protein